MSARDGLIRFFEYVDHNNAKIYAKRLSANDTGATGAHQVGVYIPREVAEELAGLISRKEPNPDIFFPTEVMSHEAKRITRLVWYNQGSRNECRITRWANEHQRNSLLSSELTGGLFIIAFSGEHAQIESAVAWFCTTIEEEDLFEERFGHIEPGEYIFDGHTPSLKITREKGKDDCASILGHIPDEWLETFPSGADIVAATFGLYRNIKCKKDEPAPDARLIHRRSCEFKLFKSIEMNHVLPVIQSGFTSVEKFIDYANSITNRRKSRSGRSFELQLANIFKEEKLPFSTGATTEGNKKPDFLFPDEARYHDRNWPEERIKMLAVKTTCKDRWRQILNEADRIKNKHLITLQEGVSFNQFMEMKAAGVKLVVPWSLQKSYPEQIRGELITLENFIKEALSIC